MSFHPLDKPTVYLGSAVQSPITLGKFETDRLLEADQYYYPVGVDPVMYHVDHHLQPKAIRRAAEQGAEPVVSLHATLLQTLLPLLSEQFAAGANDAIEGMTILAERGQIPLDPEYVDSRRVTPHDIQIESHEEHIRNRMAIGADPYSMPSAEARHYGDTIAYEPVPYDTPNFAYSSGAHEAAHRVLHLPSDHVVAVEPVSDSSQGKRHPTFISSMGVSAIVWSPDPDGDSTMRCLGNNANEGFVNDTARWSVATAGTMPEEQFYNFYGCGTATGNVAAIRGSEVHQNLFRLASADPRVIDPIKIFEAHKVAAPLLRWIENA